MKIKKICQALLFPHTVLMVILLPISVAFLVYSLVALSPESLPAILSYVLSFYTLTIWCMRLPRLISFFRDFKAHNKYARLWQDDARLRVNISLRGSLIFNTAYALLQLGMGIRHHSFWFLSLAVYYICLAVMRFFLVRHSARHLPREKMHQELLRYIACAAVLLVMNIALSVMIIFMVHLNRTFHHHEITTIALAAYTFGSLTIAILSVLRYRRYNSPVYSAAKAISLAAACVSLLTLESTMLTTFSNGTVDETTGQLLLATSGGVVSVFIICMAVYMIIQGRKKLKLITTPKE
ncbi:MAG: hypothetical protein IJV88_02370 [Ruminococcus sp.]|nr:hypothetical protein [Ruminococcus sp.]